MLSYSVEVSSIFQNNVRASSHCFSLNTYPPIAALKVTMPGSIDCRSSSHKKFRLPISSAYALTVELYMKMLESIDSPGASRKKKNDLSHYATFSKEPSTEV
eukprot:gnl/MRDRNA2_/MRDRNA2_324782_c0_seq1.p1 gnl/MRDRNA2_/MRDRNA2_324782_c0~~gnl/MRDRNA2_/MRDRNA2_324782_c0_seq1.p1  ORF type:complete len:102 (+),score=7.16 gnl/MRDRNA2_/MRDRNA2_324782_c0_seq1:522-827(+)